MSIINILLHSPSQSKRSWLVQFESDWEPWREVRRMSDISNCSSTLISDECDLRNKCLTDSTWELDLDHFLITLVPPDNKKKQSNSIFPGAEVVKLHRACIAERSKTENNHCSYSLTVLTPRLVAHYAHYASQVTVGGKLHTYLSLKTVLLQQSASGCLDALLDV